MCQFKLGAILFVFMQVENLIEEKTDKCFLNSWSWLVVVGGQNMAEEHFHAHRMGSTCPDHRPATRSRSHHEWNLWSIHYVSLCLFDVCCRSLARELAQISFVSLCLFDVCCRSPAKELGQLQGYRIHIACSRKGVPSVRPGKNQSLVLLQSIFETRVIPSSFVTRPPTPYQSITEEHDVIHVKGIINEEPDNATLPLGIGKVSKSMYIISLYHF